MKTNYENPKSVPILITTEWCLCLSYGGNGAGRPADSNKSDFNTDWSSTDNNDD